MEELRDLVEVLNNNSEACKNGRESCCCPIIPVFIFKKVNCVNIFNGACTTWSPGSPCAPTICNENA